MTRIYRLTVPSPQVERAPSPPPFAETRVLVGHEWDFEDDRLDQIPALRRWIADAGIEGVEEEGLVLTEGLFSPDDRLVDIGTPERTSLQLDPAAFDDDTCERCGLTVRRVVATKEVTASGGRDVVRLTSIPPARALLLPATVADELEAAGLAGGLGRLPLTGAGGDAVLVFSTVCVGDPVAPFGSTGERCPACGRAVPPRYSFYFVFDHAAAGEADWVWSPIYGQTHPLVTTAVARWLVERDSRVTFTKKGWYPDEVDQAFLPEEYR
jgi:hypothetical protein